MKKKPSKHVALKQLKLAREMYVMARCGALEDRLSNALDRQAECRTCGPHIRNAPTLLAEFKQKQQLWDAEVKAAQLMLESTKKGVGEYFDRTMQCLVEEDRS